MIWKVAQFGTRLIGIGDPIVTASMISKKTLRNVKISHTLGNFFGVVSIKFNVNPSGSFCKSNLIFHGILWNMSLVLQILVRLVFVGITLYQIFFKTEMMPVESCVGMSLISLLLISVVLLGVSLVRNEETLFCVNTVLRLNDYLCKSTHIQ